MGEEEGVAVAQDVADLVAIPLVNLMAIPLVTLVVILVAILVATPVDTLQEVEEVPPWLWSGQALMEEEALMEGLHMEEGPMVLHTLLGLLVLSVADSQS